MRNDGRDPAPNQGGPSELAKLVTSDPEVLGGRRVFRGTRVPIEVLFENLADGMTVDDILSEYETLVRDDLVRVLELMTEGPPA